METEVLRNLVNWLLTPRPLVQDARSHLGPGELRPMPPNQYLLKSQGGAIDRTEIVLARDNDPQAPVKKLTLILSETAGVGQRDLEKLFGAAQAQDEDGQPPPAALVRFPDVSQKAKGMDVLIFARVVRPPAPEARVCSIQFVRVTYEPVK